MATKTMAWRVVFLVHLSDQLARRDRLERELSLAHAKAMESPTEAAKAALDAVGRRLEEWELEIRTQNPDYRQLLHPETAGVRAVQQALPRGPTLLQFELDERRSFLWVVNPSGFRLRFLPERRLIEKTAREFLAAIGQHPAAGKPGSNAAGRECVRG